MPRNLNGLLWKYVKSWIGLFLILGSCRSFAPASGFDPSSLSSIPVFVLPASDTCNGIEKVFFSIRKGAEEIVVEVTVVFSDEDQPSRVIDNAYDVFRRIRYHRKKDLETFYMHIGLCGAGEEVKSIDFGDAYSGEQTFEKTFVKHFRRIVPGDRLTYENRRPVIFINTWNHLFSEKDSNPALGKMRFFRYPSFNGSRSDAEPQRRNRHKQSQVLSGM